MDESLMFEDSHTRWEETNDRKEWDDFVVRNGGSIFHLWSWRKVLESENSRALYLACRDAERRVLAVCPFFYRAGRHLLYLDSLPDSPIAGPIISDRATNPSLILESLRKSVKFSLFNPVVAMRIKAHQQPIIQTMVLVGFRHVSTHGLFILDLHERTPEHIWNDGFEKHDRQAVKYYEQHGSVFEFARNESDYLDYLTLHRGTHRDDRADFLSKIRLNLGDRLRVAVATFENRAIAGFLMLCDPPNSTVHLTTIRYSPVKNIHSPVTYVNWKAINWANEHGFRYVDFGSYPVTASSNPRHPFHKLREKFKITFVPRYLFTLPTSGISYSIARRIGRIL